MFAFISIINVIILPIIYLFYSTHALTQKVWFQAQSAEMSLICPNINEPNHSNKNKQRGGRRALIIYSLASKYA